MHHERDVRGGLRTDRNLWPVDFSARAVAGSCSFGIGREDPSDQFTQGGFPLDGPGR